MEEFLMIILAGAVGGFIFCIQTFVVIYFPLDSCENIQSAHLSISPFYTYLAASVIISS